ncbi:origin recognition complex subunit 2 [Sporobolomyces salmoneus]|uniref:origin recognition complex subunit 2 n=1 Tax=Sporobolomyces salmoneus TaxID=183962 RepID=UPI00316DCB28
MARANRAVRAANNQSTTPTSAKSRGKRKATNPPTSTTPSRKRRTTQPANYEEGSDRSDEDEEIEPAQFVTATASDAYMVYSNQVSNTTDSLLSTSIDPAFTLSSYTRALSRYDELEHPAFEPVREIQTAQLENAREKFARWSYELEQGFNIMLVGLGSKRVILNEFAERTRSKGNVVVINGFDSTCTMADLLTAVEDIVRLHGGGGNQQTEEERQPTPKKRGRSSPRKKATSTTTTAQQPAYRAARPVSALESRVRKLCLSIASLPSTSTTRFPPIYLVIHSLDSPSLRLSKHLSLLALLASQPSIHLIASIDHVRAPFLFPTSLTTSRPPPIDLDSEDQNSSSSLLLSNRSFNFLYHSLRTLLPYTHETFSLSTLSNLVPPSVYPPPLTSASSLSSSSQIQSTIHVLASVTERAKRLFNLLGRQQVAVGEMLDRTKERNLNLKTKEGESSPVVAMSINSFKNMATDLLIATHPDQVSGLLSEFKDHGVVLSSNVAPEVVEGINDEDEEEGTGGEWVWIPLEREGLEEVLEELGIEE